MTIDQTKMLSRDVPIEKHDVKLQSQYWLFFLRKLMNIRELLAAGPLTIGCMVLIPYCARPNG